MKPDRLLTRWSCACLFVLVIAACAPKGPVIDTGAKPPGASGTISGTVRDSAGNPVSARKVTAVNEATGQRLDTTTATSGGYTMKVPPGKYRLELELRAGELLSEQPSDVEISASDLDASRNFVVSTKPGAGGSDRWSISTAFALASRYTAGTFGTRAAG